MSVRCKCGKLTIYIGPANSGSPLRLEDVHLDSGTKRTWHSITHCEGYVVIEIR